MKIWKYKFLFIILRILVYAKRTLVWLLQKTWQFFVSIQVFFRNSIGFYFYKWGFKLKQKIGKENLSWGSVWRELIGKRGVLQVFFLFLVVMVMYPHSRLKAFESTHLPGRGTTLYQLLGPGDQDFSLEEINMDYMPVAVDLPTWREGAAIAQPSAGAISVSLPDVTNITIGGSALGKVNIIPGASLPQSVSGSSSRTEIIYHTVESGDTIGGIAERYQVSVVTILWANNLTANSYIRPGDKLKILPVSGLVHKVAKGDTLLKIAKLYKVETDKIIEFNKLKEDGSDLVIGEELMIPGGAKPTPAYVAPTRTYTSFSNVSAPPISAEGPATTGYLWPAGVRRITQYYGLRHTGVDIAGPVGTGLYATRAGKVTVSQCGWNGGYGCYVIIDHGDGVSSLYGHASRLLVSVGDQVEQGQNIALMGSTGRSTGSHLHFEIRIGSKRVNPFIYIR